MVIISYVSLVSQTELIPFLYDNITLFRRSGRSGSEIRLFIASCPNQRQMRQIKKSTLQMPYED